MKPNRKSGVIHEIPCNKCDDTYLSQNSKVVNDIKCFQNVHNKKQT